MKSHKLVDANVELDEAFAKISSATGDELNEIVNVIEQYGRKQKVKVEKKQELIKVVRAKRAFAFTK